MLPWAGGRAPLSPLGLTALIALLSLLPPPAAPSRILAQFQERTSAEGGAEAELRTMTYDHKRNRLYVGAVNSVYCLSGVDLGRVGTWVAGPMDDSLDCPFDPAVDCASSRKPSNNINQLLVIDTDADVLVACGTLFYGSCDLIDLTDFTPRDPVRQPTVPNDPARPVVAFFVPAARLTYDFGGVYVGASYSLLGNPGSQAHIHLLSSRKASSLDYLPGGASYIDVLAHYRVQFPIDFVAAFEHDGYAYFVITRRDNFGTTQSGTYLFRYCLNDAHLRSLVELRIECDVNGAIYGYARSATRAGVGKRLGDIVGTNVRDALYVAFTQGGPEGDAGLAGGGSTAVCAFGVKRLDEMFQRATTNCFNGEGYKGPSYIVNQQGSNCVKQPSASITSEYCGEFSGNSPVSDANPIRPAYRVMLQGVLAKSMLVSVVNDFTVAYIGSNDGKLLKVVLRSQTTGVPPPLYATVPLDVRPPYQPIRTLSFGSRDTDGLQPIVYALTNEMVYEVQTFDCDAFTSCNLCITDPHCGWCSGSNRCTPKSKCAATAFWLSERCPLVLTLDPTVAPREQYTATRFGLTLNFLPPTFREVRCAMEDQRAPGGGNQEDMIASIDGSQPGFIPPAGATPPGERKIACGPFTRLPADGPLVVNMTLKLMVDKSLWTSSIVSVYNCQKIAQCMPCTQSRYPCRWCVQRHLCMTATLDCTATTGALGLPISDPGQCARVEVTNNATLLVAAEQRGRAFSFVGFNLMEVYRSTLKCKFKMADKNVYSSATYPSAPGGAVMPRAEIVCGPVDLFYTAALPFVMVPYDLVWGNDLIVDNPRQLAVRVYKCRHLVSNCGLCLTLEAGYDCGWCGGGVGACTLTGDCAPPSVWMDRSKTCTDPAIHGLNPVGGPLKGGTLLTITGINLGKTPGDLSVAVATKPCVVQSEGYIPSQRVVCKTGPTGERGSGNVVVTANGGYMTSPNRESTYTYEDPTVSAKSMLPTRGPVSGGTRVTLTGTSLHYGSSFHVHVNGLHAIVVSRLANKVEFLTPNVSVSGMVYVVAQVDDLGDIPVRQSFEFVEDPTVSAIDPRISLVSGGSILEVTGTNLNVVQKPLLIIHHKSGNKTSPCTMRSTTKLECPTPSLSDAGSEVETQVDLAVGLVMDNVTQLLRSQNDKWVRTVTYYPDPDVTRFPRTVGYSSEELLEIKGRNLEILYEFRELSITVGGAKCWIDNPDSSHTLKCRPPTLDDKKELNGNDEALVLVLMGNYRREVGYVSYAQGPRRLPLILGLVFGLLLPVLIIVCVIAFLVVRRRRRAARRGGRGGKPMPSLLDMTRSPPTPGGPARTSNPYQEGAGGGAAGETEPLRSRDDKEEAGIIGDDGSVVKDDRAYFQELLKRIDNPRIRSAAKEVFIERERLELGNLLGKGHFGRVYAATLRDEGMKQPKPVAVKTIEDQDLNHKLMESFLQEGIIMKNFNHPHVLSLIGLCLGYKREPMVILPFMAHGDLRTYVKDKRMSFTARQLLLLAQQVAEGMSYLSSLNFIHRDLAARNCMIDDKNVVKVADFGLSHELYDREYYASKDPKSKLPIKWMALESLEEFVFTIKSDVWSFGVLMWELMTRGVTPYPDVEVFETRNYLASGHRLRKPKYCPDNVYAIMTDCWNDVPERRPTFNDLVNRLEVLLSPPKQAGAAGSQGTPSSPGGGEPTYINVAEPPAENQDYLKPISD